MKIIVLLSMMGLFNTGMQSTHKLSVSIENIKEPQGQLIIAIYNSKETFLEEPFQSQIIDVTDKTEDITFGNLPEGEYSVSVIYDKNKNGELDKNFFGIPTEGFGFSKKSMGTFGPPSYNDTKLKVKDGTASIAIPLKYM